MSNLHKLLAIYEKQVITDALTAHFGNRTKTASWLGVSRRCLLDKIRQFDIQVPYVRQPRTKAV